MRSAPQVEGDWICCAREDIRLEQVAKLTLQVAVRVCVRRSGERSAAKKEFDV